MCGHTITNFSNSVTYVKHKAPIEVITRPLDELVQSSSIASPAAGDEGRVGHEDDTLRFQTKGEMKQDISISLANNDNRFFSSVYFLFSLSTRIITAHYVKTFVTTACAGFLQICERLQELGFFYDYFSFCTQLKKCF